MEELLTFTVRGTPGPQGSKRHVGKGRMIESSAKVAPWRAAVESSARQAVRAAVKLSGARWVPYPGAVLVVVTFTLRRPVSIPKRVIHHTKYPDVDKLLRSTGDAMVLAQVLGDDAQIVTVISTKLYVGAPGALTEPGAFVSIWILPDEHTALLTDMIRLFTGHHDKLTDSNYTNVFG